MVSARTWFRFITLALTGMGVGSFVFAPPNRQVRIRWRGHSGVDYMQYQYQVFDGAEEKGVSAHGGDEFALDYDLQVYGGELFVELINPNGECLWQRRLHDSETDSLRLGLSENGIYRIKVSGSDASGGFSLRWWLEGPGRA